MRLIRNLITGEVIPFCQQIGILNLNPEKFTKILNGVLFFRRIPFKNFVVSFICVIFASVIGLLHSNLIEI